MNRYKINIKNSYKGFIMKFWFRFFALIDVLFSSRFELITYRKNGQQSSKTKFDSLEIQRMSREGKL